MKRLLLVLIVILTSLGILNAQSKKLLIVPNWEVGDVYHYNKDVKAIRVNINNDSTIKTQGSYDFYLKILDKNNSGYTLRLDYPSSIYTQIFPDIQSLRTKDYLSIYFLTDLTGSFMEVINDNSLLLFFRELINAMYDFGIAPNMSKADFEVYMKKVFPPEIQMASMMKDIEILLWQNGIEAKIGDIYEDKSLINMSGVKMPVNIKYMLDIESFNGNPTFYILKAVKEFDKTEMLPFVNSFAPKFIDSLREYFNCNDAEIRDFLLKSEITYKEYNYTVIPFDIGWVYNTQLKSEIVITLPEGQLKEIEISNIQQIN